MAYIVGSIPYIKCYVRREFTRNLLDRHGEFIPAYAYGVRCRRGDSLWFQCMLCEVPGEPNDTGGASFMVPIQALCVLPCDPPKMEDAQPWDTFSSDFGVCEFDMVRRGKVYVLPDRKPAEYLFTLDFTGSDLADDAEQHKHLHVVAMECGWIGAFPNNRLLWRDDAAWKVMDQRPDFTSLDGEFRAEGLWRNGRAELTSARGSSRSIGQTENSLAVRAGLGQDQAGVAPAVDAVLQGRAGDTQLASEVAPTSRQRSL
jgi:hypothetical protein